MGKRGEGKLRRHHTHFPPKVKASPRIFPGGAGGDPPMTRGWWFAHPPGCRQNYTPPPPAAAPGREVGESSRLYFSITFAEVNPRCALGCDLHRASRSTHVARIRQNHQKTREMRLAKRRASVGSQVRRYSFGGNVFEHLIWQQQTIFAAAWRSITTATSAWSWTASTARRATCAPSCRPRSAASAAAAPPMCASARPRRSTSSP